VEVSRLTAPEPQVVTLPLASVMVFSIPRS